MAEIERNNTERRIDGMKLEKMRLFEERMKEYGKAVDEAIHTSDKPILVDGDIQGQLECLRQNYIFNQKGLCFFIGYEHLHEGLYGNFVNGKEIPPTWYTQFCLLCLNKTDEVCVMIFDGLDKISITEDVREFFDEVLFNKSNKFPLPANGKIVFIPRTKFLTPELNSILNEYRSKFTTVRCYLEEGVSVDYGEKEQEK